MVIGSTPALPPDPHRLRRRLLLQGGGFALLLLLAFSASLYWGIAAQRSEDQRSELRQLAASAAAQLPLIVHESREAPGALKFKPPQQALTLPGVERQRVQWFDASGALLSEQGGLALPPVAGGLPQQRSTPSWLQWSGGLSLWQPVVIGRSGPIGFVRVALSNQAALNDLHRLQRGLLLGAVVTVLAALLVGRRMLQAAWEPLQRQVIALQRFTADASHELRHPLTALRTLLAAVPPELRQHPALAWRELDGLSRQLGEQLDDLLLLARLEQAGQAEQTRPEAWQHFDLLELLEDLIAAYSAHAAQKDVQLQLRPDPRQHQVMVRARSEELRRLFTNLLVNAIRHSPQAGAVELQVIASNRQLQVAVIDQGPGIPAQAQERVFDRHWRGSDQGGHSGLGLAIARAIARRHGGELRVSESRPGRCVLLVQLPTNQPSS